MNEKTVFDQASPSRHKTLANIDREKTERERDGAHCENAKSFHAANITRGSTHTDRNTLIYKHTHTVREGKLISTREKKCVPSQTPRRAKAKTKQR